MSDTETAKSTLEGWAREGQLASATLSADGTSLTLGGTSITANIAITVSHDGKSCSYTVASIFLQLLDPNQGLVPYRKLCSKHQVKDPVKPLEKPIIVAAFLGISTAAAPPPAPTAPALAPDKRSEKKSKRDKHLHKPSSKRKYEHERHERGHKPSKRRGPEKTFVTNEQLFDSLNTVVGKRDQGSENLKKEMEEITKALSPKGFEITPELLEEHRERTNVITASEMPVGNSASILRAANPNKNLSRVLELFNEATNAAASSKKSGKHNVQKKLPSSLSSPASKPLRQQHLIGKKPIIIVPKGMTAAITLANAHEFLCNARFVPRDVLVKQGRHRSPATTFTRTVHGATGATGLLEYEIVDNPRKLGPTAHDWDRVVAVIALGQSWQFKDWLKGYNAPATLFEKVYGYFVCMEGAKVPAEVSGWAVHQSRLNRDKRGLDQVAYASFWNGLDEFMRVRKPELLPQAEG